MKYFANLLLKIHIVAPIDHMFRVSHCWIHMKISKCVNFARLYVSSWKFIIILNHTKICLTSLCFCFLYHKLQLCFLCHAHYTPFTCGKGLLNFFFFENYFEFFNFKIPYILKIVSVFWTWVVGYYHLNFFTIKIMLLQ